MDIITQYDETGRVSKVASKNGQASLGFIYDPTTQAIAQIELKGRKDQIKELMTYFDIVNRRFIDLIMNIKNIENIENIDVIKDIAKIHEVLTIGNIDNVAVVETIEAITELTTLATVTNIVNLESIDLIDAITNIVNIDNIVNIENIETIGEITTITDPVTIEVATPQTRGNWEPASSIPAGESAYITTVTGKGRLLFASFWCYDTVGFQNLAPSIVMDDKEQLIDSMSINQWRNVFLGDNGGDGLRIGNWSSADGYANLIVTFKPTFTSSFKIGWKNNHGSTSLKGAVYYVYQTY